MRRSCVSDVLLHVSLLLLVSNTALAQSSIDYHPNGVVRLGFGYEPSTPTVPFVSVCISHEGVESIDPSGIAVGSVEVSEVSDRRSLLSTVGISASMEAHTAMFSGGASFSQNVGVSFDESTLVWVARIKINFGRYRLKNPVPTPLLTEAANPSEAKARCGPEVVSQESRGAIAAVVYEVHNLTNSEKRELSAALNAKYSGPNAGASFDSAYNNVAQKIQSRVSIKTYVHVQGGPGSQVLAKFVSATDLAAVKAALTEYGRATTPANAAPLTYQTSPLSQFSNLSFQAPPNLAQDRLWEIYSQYENLTGLIRRIDFLVKPTSEAEMYLVKYVSPAKRSELNDVRILYESGRNALKLAAVACLTGETDCSVPTAVGNLPRVAWPPIPPGLSLVGISRCQEIHLEPARIVSRRSPPPPPATGQRIGFSEFVLGLSGDQTLFDSVWLITPDSRVPLAPAVRIPKITTTDSSKPTSDEPKTLAELAETMATFRLLLTEATKDPVDELFERRPTNFSDCTIRSEIDRTLLFGGVSLGIEQRKDVPLPTVEILDKLGRRSVFELDKFQ
ncbi:hypothetical protein [Candidatus Manganitrophus noduliformans]|uniref:SPOR domain-containing protein n=1 Tax=Candidatus Manganitrophus noduliformans TaxID=2606439 RepID=A0A7X6IBE4_9BACT|nr:hypothetical protein [Candidatus Manganitrophus noduliformans]NKE71319.1 hypothetical protein [Candidatus Manganitrophus noduliformans]